MPESLQQRVAPPHPDVEGQNPETRNQENGAVPQPPRIEVESDVEKEKSLADEEKKAKPASEPNEATGAQAL